MILAVQVALCHNRASSRPVSRTPGAPSFGGFVICWGVLMNLWHVYPEELISGAEAAQIAGVSEATIRQWATRKKIHRFPGRRRCEGTLYARPEIEALAVLRHQSAAAA